jgi:hypothetical protein
MMDTTVRGLPTVDEIDRAFDEAAGIIPEGVPPLSDEAISPESIYAREDGWNSVIFQTQGTAYHVWRTRNRGRQFLAAEGSLKQSS